MSEPPTPPPKSATLAGRMPAVAKLSISATPTANVPAQPITLFAPQRNNSYHRPTAAASSAATDPSALTPLRAHYLKRELVTFQFAKELELLSTPDALSVLGPPFLPAQHFVNGVPTERPSSEARRSTSQDEVELPFLRYFFNHFVLSFPFLTNAPKSFFSHKLQPFVYSFFSRNISGTEDREEETKRRKIAGKVEKHLGLVMAAAIKLSDNGGAEEVIRVSAPGQIQDARPNDEDAFIATPTVGEAPMAMAAIAGNVKSGDPAEAMAAQIPRLTTFAVNVVAVRTIRIKGRVRTKAHEEFIIRTSMPAREDVFVSRRHGDFTKLAASLRVEFPEMAIRAPPAKDRRIVDAHQGDESPSSRSAASTENLASPASPPDTPNSAAPPPAHLARERNRLTLRAYLHRLLSKPDLANSEHMRNFLLTDPITPSDAELADAAVREEMDRTREHEMAKFRAEVEGRVRELEGYLRGFRDELVKSDGLTRVFGTIRTTPKAEDLPIEYKKVLEWARISLASTVYQLFLGSDNSSSAFAQLKRMHGLMPYWAMRGVLRISNPVAMIRGILDLFLARPFGTTSLLQRMFTSGLYEEVKELREDADKVAAKVADDRFCHRVRNYVNAPREIQEVYEADARVEDVDLMSVILRSPEGPAFDRAAFQRISRAAPEYEKYKAYRDALEDPSENQGPANEDAWLFEDLHVYMKLMRRARDKEQMIELIFEGTTSELLKDIVTIFYSPLMQVYKAANIADSLYDLQRFIDDLIKTVERAESFSIGDPQRVVQTFVDLVARHEGAFYHFVHQVHSKGAGLFDGLMAWIELFVTFVREGLTRPVSLDVLLPHAGAERAAILQEVDEIIEYHRKLKVAHHERMARRMARGEEDPHGTSSDTAFVRGVVADLHLAKVVGDVDDVAIEEEGEEDTSEAEDEDEFADARSNNSLPPEEQEGSHDGPDGEYVSPRQPNGAPKRARKRDRAAIEPPELKRIPELTPIFTEVVKQLLTTQTQRASR